MADDNQCPICFNSISNAKSLKCSHRFCKRCIDIWLAKMRRCPMCRCKIEIEGDRDSKDKSNTQLDRSSVLESAWGESDEEPETTTVARSVGSQVENYNVPESWEDLYEEEQERSDTITDEGSAIVLSTPQSRNSVLLPRSELVQTIQRQPAVSLLRPLEQERRVLPHSQSRISVLLRRSEPVQRLEQERRIPQIIAQSRISVLLPRNEPGQIAQQQSVVTLRRRRRRRRRQQQLQEDNDPDDYVDHISERFLERFSRVKISRRSRTDNTPPTTRQHHRSRRNSQYIEGFHTMYDWSFKIDTSPEADEMIVKKLLNAGNSENGFTEDSSDDEDEARLEMMVEPKMLQSKSRSPNRAEGADDASPGSSIRLVSHAGACCHRKRREQNLSARSTKQNDSQNTNFPLGHVNIQLKLKEELDKELEIKRVAGDQDAPNYMKLPPKSKSPSRILSRAAEGADDASRGSSSRLVSHARGGIREMSEQKLSHQTTKQSDSQNTISPMMEVVNVQLKLKEELDEELEIKQDMKIQEGGGGDEAE